MSLLWNIMSEFLSTVSRKKAHWYRVFDPGDIEPSYEKIQATFPSLATLTIMEDCQGTSDVCATTVNYNYAIHAYTKFWEPGAADRGEALLHRMEERFCH